MTNNETKQKVTHAEVQNAIGKVYNAMKWLDNNPFEYGEPPYETEMNGLKERAKQLFFEFYGTKTEDEKDLWEYEETEGETECWKALLERVEVSLKK